eukprot:symbB.v1.2.041459.t1/scaffold8231.1/size7159/1
MLSKVACLLVVVAAVESEVGPCERPAMLKAVKQMAPDCIDACPIICPKLNSLIMTALMGIDPTSQVCNAFDVWVCMDRPSCRMLLATAASYDLFPVPQNEAELRATCDMPPASTTQEGQHSIAGAVEIPNMESSNETTLAQDSVSTSQESVRSSSSTSSQVALRGTESTTSVDFRNNSFSNDAVLYDFAHHSSCYDWMILLLVLAATGRLM